MNGHLPPLCDHEDCRRLHGHAGRHDPRPTEVWEFFQDRDKNKLAKAGFATPRGGAKNAYQNHVVRSSKVIIPYERLADVDVGLFRDGYASRLLPEQLFLAPGVVRPEFAAPDAPVVVGQNAFVLYRTHESFRSLPPLPGWRPRSLLRAGQPVTDRRGNVDDIGEYVIRLSRIGPN